MDRPDPNDLLGGPDVVQTRCEDWSLTLMHPVAETHSSLVFKVQRADGTPAALKILKNIGREEIRGAAFLDWAQGQGAVALYAQSADAMLVEWLDGEPLGDMVRRGQDRDATQVICALLPQLHSPRAVAAKDLRPMGHRAQALFDPPVDLVPGQMMRDLAKAQDLGRRLLATSSDIGPLHGDLHHDNIIKSPRGWLAFDPKGLIGDRAYEVANVFRNPVGAFDQVRQPERIRHLAARFAPVLATPPHRILAWAAVHTALSMCWALQDGHRDVAEHIVLLPMLLAMAEAEG